MSTPLVRRPVALVAGICASSVAIAGLAVLSGLSGPAGAAPSGVIAPRYGYAGAPVNPAPYTITQPDGSKLRVHRFGDALSNGVATVQGDQTLVRGRDGYWRYASGLTRQGDLLASSVVAGRGAAPRAASGLAPEPRAQQAPLLTPKAGSGSAPELVILASFEDQDPVGSTEGMWANRYFGAQGSVADFYDEASQGQFRLTPAEETYGTADNGVVGWIKLPEKHPDSGLTQAPDYYVADAIEAASDYVDFDSFDTDGNGDLTSDELHVTVVAAGYEASYGAPCGRTVWGHQYGLEWWGISPPSVDDVTVGKEGYTTFGEWHCDADRDNPGHMATMGVLAHELGHDINWPDLYDPDSSSSGVGRWSVMSGGSWGSAPGQYAGASPGLPDAWSRYYQGWISPQVVTSATNDVSVPAGGAVLVSPNPGGVDWLFNEHTGEGEYFLVENRQRAGYDASLPGCGLLVYRVDETVIRNNLANSDELDPLVKVIEADGSDDLASARDSGTAGDPFPGTSATHDLTAARTLFHDGTPSGLALHVDDSGCADSMTIDVTPGSASQNPVPVPPNDDFASAKDLTGTAGVVEQSTKQATLEDGEPLPAGYGWPSVWYRWTAPTSGELSVSTVGSGYDTVLGVYTGSAVDRLSEVAVNDNADHPAGTLGSEVVTRVSAGTTYLIAADGSYAAFGRLRLAWGLAADPVTTPTPTSTPTPTPTPTSTSTPTPTPTQASPTATPTAVLAPANDEFASPQRLKGGRGRTRGTTSGADVEADEEMFRAAKGGAASVWFRWKAKVSGTVTFRARGDFKPLLAITRGRHLAGLDVLGSDTVGSRARVTVDVEKGRTYRIVLDGRYAGSGPYTLSWVSHR